MRIAKPVSHQNFERILHFPRGVCLLECLFIPTNPSLFLEAGERLRSVTCLQAHLDEKQTNIPFLSDIHLGPCWLGLTQEDATSNCAISDGRN